MEAQEHKELLDTIVATNDKRYNMEKAVEELLELSEVLMKKMLKKGSAKEPKDSDVVEEIGDVAIRLAILSRMFGKENVQNRINYKLEKYNDYFKKGLYIGKI